MLDAENAAILKWLVGRENCHNQIIHRLDGRRLCGDYEIAKRWRMHAGSTRWRTRLRRFGSSRMKFALILAPRGRGRPRKNAGSIYEAHKDAAETDAAIEAQESEGRERLRTSRPATRLRSKENRSQNVSHAFVCGSRRGQRNFKIVVYF